MLPRPSGLTAAAVLAALLLVPAQARAKPGEDKVISGSVDYAGDATFRNLTIKAGGTLRMLKKSGATQLAVTANTIVIEQGGAIVVDGAGYEGVANGPGDAPAASNGGGGYGMNVGSPGGGGGMFGAGAFGAVAAGCTDSGLSAGGLAYFDMANHTPEFGAAGGAAHTPTGVATAGASGGGVIILTAGKITIDGTISARGASANEALGGVGPGGGAGGTIKLFAGEIDGTTGIISVRGGNGAHGKGLSPQYVANDGGGGSGGVIILALPAGKMLPAGVMTDVAGGATGTCTGTGAAGEVVPENLPGSCVDLDMDGENALACGGTDCDDTDPEVNTKAKEACDGVDNDCKGGVDDGNLCADGQICSAGKCADDPDAGTDAGATSDGGVPDHVEFGGGCAVPAPSRGGLAEGALGAAMLALGTLLLGAGRRRRR